MQSRVLEKPLCGLQFLRFFAAAAIVVYHYQFYLFTDGNAGSAPFQNVLGLVYRNGDLAVPLFWTLSGYIFFWKYEKAVAEQSISAFRFGWLRFSRLYPLHFCTLLAIVVLQITYQRLFGQPYWNYREPFNVSMFVAQLFLAAKWISAQNTFNGPVWSVSIEVLIYALFFVLARSLPLRRSAVLIAVVAVAAIGYWTAVHGLDAAPPVLIFKCSVCFFVGGLCTRARGLTSQGRGFVLLGVIAGTAALYLVRPNYASAFALPVACVLFFSTGRLWNCPMIQRVSVIGNLTYGSYLLHFPIALAAVIALKVVGISLAASQSPWILLSYLIVVFAAAQLSFEFFEQPAQIVLRRLLYRPEMLGTGPSAVTRA